MSLYLRRTAYGRTGESTVNAYGQPGWEPSAYYASQWGLQKAFTPPGWQTYQDLLPYGRWPTDSGYEPFDWSQYAIRGSSPIAGLAGFSGSFGQASDVANLISNIASGAGGVANVVPQIQAALPAIQQAAIDFDSITIWAQIFFGVGIAALALVGVNQVRKLMNKDNTP